MAKFFTLENQISQVDSVVLSMDNLLNLVKDVNKIDCNTEKTISEIIGFVQKVMKILPEVLISEKSSTIVKKDLLVSYKKVVDSWQNYNESRSAFFKAWEDFKDKWDTFSSSLSQMKKKGNTIYLSMN